MEIRRIGIAGAGTMGYSMADIFASSGFDVTLWNHRLPTLERAKTLISRESRDKIRYTTDMAELKDADIVVENVKEDLKVKQEFFKALCTIVGEKTIIATNTSGLSINKLAEAVTHKERFLGMHWFNPPTLILLIEIIKNDETRQDIAEAVKDLALKIEKRPVIVHKDVPGFAANRIQMAVVREALSLVKKGVLSPEDMDDVMKYGLAFRWACIGPLETMDFGGIDTFYHVASYLVKDLDDSREVPSLLKEHYEKGELGVKTGKGFYDYSSGKDKEATERRDEKLKKVFDALYR